MALKYFLLIGIIIAIASSKRLRGPEGCKFHYDFKAVKNHVEQMDLQSCKLFFKNQTTTEWMKTDVNCIAKCRLEVRGVFDKDGKYVSDGIRNFYKKFSNATENFVGSVGKIYDECKTLSATVISDLKTNGTGISECRPYGVFHLCVIKGVFAIKEC